MKGYKVTSTLLICILCAVAEEQIKDDQQLNSVVKRTEKLVLQKSQPYTKRSIREEPSFLSKLKSWIFPFGGNDSSPDSIPAPGHHFTPKYLPPPNHNEEYKPNCNPCNREPWIPVFTNYGKNTIIGFVQPSEVGNRGPYVNGGHDITSLEHLHPPAVSVNNQYGPPHNNIPANQYGPPQSGAPHQDYGPPNGIPQQEYGPPFNPTEYGVPPAIQGNVPFKEYGPPHNEKPAEGYGPPLNKLPQDYQTPPNGIPIREYGPPPNGPAQEYGPPPPPPRQHGHDPQPFRNNIEPYKQIRQLQYGPPSIKPPRPEYGPPFAQHGPPHNTKQKLIPIPTDHFVPPPFHKQNAHRSKHGPPRFIPRQNGKYPQPNKYGPPFLPPNMMPPPVNGYKTNYGVPNQFSNYQSPNSPPGGQMLPLPFPSDSYGKPVTGSNIDYGLSFQANKGEYLEPLKDLSLLSSSNHDIQISQSIPLPVFDEILEIPNEPIAFPNLNYLPVLPLRNAQNFHPDFIDTTHGDTQQENVPNQSTKVEVQVSTDVYNGGNNIQRIPQNALQQNIVHQQGTTVEIQRSKQTQIYDGNSNNFANNFIDTKTTTGAKTINHHEETVTDVQIVPSITVANFLSSIEYPINLIQSPVVDVTASEFNENKGTNVDPIKLSSNPIIVEANNGDSHPSASALNGTLHESKLKRGNDDDLAIPNLENQNIVEVPHPAAINQFLDNSGPTIHYYRSKEVVQNPTKFTATPIDYGSWSLSNTISTSMIPPPPGESSWLSTINGVGEQIITTTVKPKQVQIIIPYTTINKGIKERPHQLLGRKIPPYAEPKLSLYTQPPRTESVWLEHMDESKKVTTATYAEKPKTIINIKDLLKKEQDKNFIENLPFDIITLQKNIDKWTAQEYSKEMNRFEYQKASTVSQWVPSKKIPDAYLTTSSYNITNSEEDYDHEPAGSNNKEATFHSNFESNFIFTDTTTELGTTEDFVPTELPEIKVGKTATKTDVHPMYSALIKDNVYVVTPQPRKHETVTASAVAFSDPPKIGGKEGAKESTNVTYLSRTFDNEVKPAQKTKTDFNDSVRIIYSDWPHLINNLETTTKKSSTTRHPLFGQIDLSSYISPPNSTVRTFTGHSKVITVVTPISISKRKSDVNSDSPVSKSATTEATKI